MTFDSDNRHAGSSIGGGSIWKVGGPDNKSSK